MSSQGYILIDEFREKLKECGVVYVEDLYEKVRGAKKPTGSGQADQV